MKKKSDCVCVVFACVCAYGVCILVCVCARVCVCKYLHVITFLESTGSAPNDMQQVFVNRVQNNGVLLVHWVALPYFTE